MNSALRGTSIALLSTLLAFASPPANGADASTCPGDCNGNGAVTINELIVGVDIALETEAIATCPAFDVSGDGVVTVNEIILGVNASLNDCPSPPATATPMIEPTSVGTATPTSAATTTPTEGPPATATPEAAATATATEVAPATLTPAPTATATPSPESGTLPVSEVVARDAAGVAVHLGETVTTEGVLTVSAGIFANNKLKVFAQEGLAGVMVYHETSSQVPAFQAGDRLQVRGLVRQKDPTSDANPANGTVTVDVTHGSWQVLSSNNAQPSPQQVTLATLKMDGTRYTGAVVRVQNVRKVAGTWPKVGDKSTQVTISDDDGVTQLILRFQKNTITEAMDAKLRAIGDGPFTLSGIVVQDDPSTDGTLLHGFEIWVRGADDIEPAS